jgi:hypothetical protein
MLQTERKITDKRAIDLRQSVLQAEQTEQGRQRGIEAIEAKIKAEINEKIGWGVWMGWSEKEAIRKEINERY